MTRLIWFLATIWVMAILSPASADSVIYLVRHGEVAEDGTKNPHLNVVGRARAEWLADYFDERGIGAVFSTPLNRTRETAEPTARRLNLPVQSYDAADLAGFAERLKQTDGIYLVSGHSNTTPMLVNALIGEERFQWLQHYQYDFIFRVFLGRNGESRVSIDFSQPRSAYGDHPDER